LRRARLSRTAALFLVGATACGQGAIGLGADPDFFWFTDHETGDTTDWERGGSELGATYTTQGGELAVVTGPARSGRHALRSTLSTPSTAMASQAAALRQGTLPQEAYYSAWFFLPSPASLLTDGYWVFLKWRGRTNPNDDTSLVDLWDLDLERLADGQMSTYFYHHSTGRLPPLPNHPTVPIGRWFQIEAFFRAASDGGGQITIWQDGALIFDVRGTPTAPSSWILWSVGSIGQLLQPANPVLYLDDAAITRRRLGPTFPAFATGD
jgi:hypothetical protein